MVGFEAKGMGMNKPDDARVTRGRSNIRMDVFDVVGVHVVVGKKLKQFPSELDSMLSVGDVGLNQWPHFQKQSAAPSQAASSMAVAMSRQVDS